MSYSDSWPYLVAGVLTAALAAYVYSPRTLPTIVHDPDTGECVSVINPKGHYWDCTSIPLDMPVRHIFDDRQPQT